MGASRRSASPHSGGFGLRGGQSFEVFAEQLQAEVAVHALTKYVFKRDAAILAGWQFSDSPRTLD